MKASVSRSAVSLLERGRVETARPPRGGNPRRARGAPRRTGLVERDGPRSPHRCRPRGAIGVGEATAGGMGLGRARGGELQPLRRARSDRSACLAPGRTRAAGRRDQDGSRRRAGPARRNGCQSASGSGHRRAVRMAGRSRRAGDRLPRGPRPGAAWIGSAASSTATPCVVKPRSAGFAGPRLLDTLHPASSGSVPCQTHGWCALAGSESVSATPGVRAERELAPHGRRQLANATPVSG